MNFLTLENFYNSDKLYPCSNIEFSFHSSVQIHSDYVYKICFSQFPVFYLQKNEFYAYIIFPKWLSYFFLFVTTKTSQLLITKQIFVLNNRQKFLNNFTHFLRISQQLFVSYRPLFDSLNPLWFLLKLAILKSKTGQD